MGHLQYGLSGLSQLLPDRHGNLGFQTVYKIFNEHSFSFLCERVFLPASGNDAEYVSGAAEIVSLESQKSIAEFDILAFSLSFENDYPHVLKMLTLAGIPLLAKDRPDSYPLVIGGGIALRLIPSRLPIFLICLFWVKPKKHYRNFAIILKKRAASIMIAGNY